MEIFLSHSFRAEDQRLVARVEALLSSHDVRMITGRRLEGGAITPEVMARIERSNALIALITRGAPHPTAGEGAFLTHPWVVHEINHARGHNPPIPAIGLVEDGVELEGAYRENERIHFGADTLVDAFLALSETIRIWKKKYGRVRTAHLLPPDVAHELRRNRNLGCRFRFVTLGGEMTDWIQTEPVPGQGGSLLYLNGVPDENAQVQVEIADGNATRWWSELTPQTIRIEMRRDQ